MATAWRRQPSRRCQPISMRPLYEAPAPYLPGAADGEDLNAGAERSAKEMLVINPVAAPPLNGAEANSAAPGRMDETRSRSSLDGASPLQSNIDFADWTGI